MRTGDIGRVEDGLLYLSSRRTDLIIRGGENVYPAEIENRLVEHPAVVECAVYGVDHRLLGQQVKAVVVRRPGAEAPTPDELAAWVGQTLAPFKVPEHFEIRDEPLAADRHRQGDEARRERHRRVVVRRGVTRRGQPSRCRPGRRTGRATTGRSGRW